MTEPAPEGTEAGTAPGVDLATAETDLGTIITDGRGMTLYFYTEDVTGSGVNGQGVGGVWYAVRPDGEMVTE